MGIDKPDIRRVVHYGCPKSLEAYYQESGRCGRDGLPSQCWMYYTRSDFAKGEYYTAGTTTAARKHAVLDSYAAAKDYCTTLKCRRSTLLKYFGDIPTVENCGNCDNCVRPGGIQYRNLAEETHLLLSAVKACGGKFGLGVPIDVLRGSMVKKVVDNGFDKSPVHGLGRGRNQNWWKSLADQLLGLGYLEERVSNNFRLVSVADKGDQFLWSASNMGLISSLMLPINQEMALEDAKRGEASPLPKSNMDLHLQSEGFSEIEQNFYHILMEMRADIARRNSTSPYAILSGKTLQTIAKTRPSTEARLRNIDGVNQWLVTWHGKEILDAIKTHSMRFSLSLDDFESSSQPSSVPKLKLDMKINSSKGDVTKISPAKEEAWRMWQEQGLSFLDIANLPERPKPILEDTVISYLCDCIKAGYEVDWDRFCTEVGFTREIALAVRAAVERAGSAELLKPIKEHAPEHITYRDIKVYLLQEGCKLPFPKTAEPESETEELGCRIVDSATVGIRQEMSILQKGCDGGEDECCPGLFARPSWLIDEFEKPKKPSRRKAGRESSPFEQGLLKKVKPSDHNPEGSSENGKRTSQKLSYMITKEEVLEHITASNGASLATIFKTFSHIDEAEILKIMERLQEQFLIYAIDEEYKAM